VTCSGNERGAGTVLILVTIMVVTTAFLAVAVLASGVAARRQAAAAADLAAVAAAARAIEGPGAACTTAEHIAAANNATLLDCVVDGHEVEVQVGVAVTGPGASWLPDQERRARAGPQRGPFRAHSTH
jgi:secretion/DNA translocation related TadE-like protein